MLFGLRKQQTPRMPRMDVWPIRLWKDIPQRMALRINEHLATGGVVRVWFGNGTDQVFAARLNDFGRLEVQMLQGYWVEPTNIRVELHPAPVAQIG